MTGRSKRPEAALGFRAHSGWACAVLLAGDRRAVTVLERKRVLLCEEIVEGSKQPFHHAEPMEFAAAKEFITRCTRATDRLAAKAVAALRTMAEEQNHQMAGVCLTTASGRKLPDLRGILASHALIHAAEGEFYRDALQRAAEDSGLSVSRIREKDAFEWTVSRMGLTESALRDKLAALGKSIGPPWSADEKLATMAAWLVLAK